jgi:hypothetical protein
MKTSIRNGLLLLLAFIAIGSIYGVYLYNKPHKNVENADPVKSLSADELYLAYSEDETKANNEISEQVIEVSGKIYSLETDNVEEPQIVLSTNDPSGFIRCGFKPEELQKIQTLKEGNSIKIKGLCKGMNMAEGLDLLADIDIVISKCMIIE